MSGKGSDLDRRVAAGPKVMAAGEAALAMTPDQAREAGWVIRARCARCDRRGFLSCYRLAEQGLGARPLAGIVGRLRCQKGCGGSPMVELVDPYVSALGG